MAANPATTSHVPLNVSYGSRQLAKDVGARWDPDSKQWLLALPAALAHKSMWQPAYLLMADALEAVWQPKITAAPGLALWEGAAYTGGNGWTP